MRHAGAVLAQGSVAVADAASVWHSGPGPAAEAVNRAVVGRIAVADAARIYPALAAWHASAVQASVSAAAHSAQVG